MPEKNLTLPARLLLALNNGGLSLEEYKKLKDEALDGIATPPFKVADYIRMLIRWGEVKLKGDRLIAV